MTHPEAIDPEYRCDPITGRWTIIASERARRPIRHPPTESGSVEPSECPFCEGAEEKTPPEIAALRSSGPANGPGWSVRVVPNRYPAVRRDCAVSTVSPKAATLGGTLEQVTAGRGEHEVVVECPRHRWTISGESDEHVGRVFGVYRDRLRDLGNRKGLAYALVFKNAGFAAGATQEHAHSQILATAYVPAHIAEEVRGSARHFEARGQCIYCDLMRSELSTGKRIVSETPAFVAWCPFASRFPFEVWICPKEHDSRFEMSPDDNIGELGALVRSLLIRLESLAPRVAYNYFLHTAPFRTEVAEHYHWHLEIIPRLSGLAGLELGGGMFINPVAPESAARQWREGGVGD